MVCCQSHWPVKRPAVALGPLPCTPGSHLPPVGSQWNPSWRPRCKGKHKLQRERTQMKPKKTNIRCNLEGTESAPGCAPAHAWKWPAGAALCWAFQRISVYFHSQGNMFNCLAAKYSNYTNLSLADFDSLRQSQEWKRNELRDTGCDNDSWWVCYDWSVYISPDHIKMCTTAGYF